MLIPIQRWRASLLLGTLFGLLLAILAFIGIFLASAALLFWGLNCA
ncbi:hypothetical protein VST7929_02876 [Vibrio stylophorae]|uniref:Uncharacterized protein n=1 Tax=Vibrio stylophorae TaxID=659351 RepID=A0ABN8E1G1_9VIBR|nr:hypothetical protein [Vibrio stylophorae]CAH0535222.1 hypothetical protein VST7929_02876 [Vibrio stylophorae]